MKGDLEVLHLLLHAFDELLSGELEKQVVGEDVLPEEHPVEREGELAFFHHGLVYSA